MEYPSIVFQNILHMLWCKSFNKRTFGTQHSVIEDGVTNGRLVIDKVLLLLMFGRTFMALHHISFPVIPLFKCIGIQSNLKFQPVCQWTIVCFW